MATNIYQPALGNQCKFVMPASCVHCRYNSATGVATIPSGGAGQYYLSTYLLVDDGETAQIQMMVNDNDVVCTAAGDQNTSGASDLSTATCSGVAQLEDGEFAHGTRDTA